MGFSEIKVEDILEIRPGLITKDKTNIILKTKVCSIFSEQESVKTVEKGGLYALGTTLDPSITKADKLVGCVAGFPDQLPPVIKNVDVQVNYVKLYKNQTKIIDGQDYMFIWGNLVVNGKCKLIEKKKYSVCFEHPVCLYQKRCIIYSKQNQSNRNLTMLGIGTITEMK